MEDHPDQRLRKTKVTIDFPTSEAEYPTIIVRFFERGIRNAGVGHMEWILQDGRTFPDKFKHYLYDGDIEFAIFGLSSLDRDLLSDSLVQVLAMPEMATYTKQFWDRIYLPVGETNRWNYVNLNTDKILGFGETQAPQPWLSEDQLVYQTSYRVGIYGEFYSLPPLEGVSPGNITKVNLYPYMTDLEPIPEGTDDPADWQGGDDSFL
jgi:hypothetical protein